MRPIDGDKLIEVLKADDLELSEFNFSTYAVINTIKKMPTIEPERKRGRWITETKHHKDDEQEFYYLEVRCSECGAIRRVGWLNARYCPACGCEIESEYET